MLRLFIAIDLPESIKARLADLCSGLPDAKWVKHEQMHLTLHFIGDVDQDGFASIKTALMDAAAPAFEMHLEGVGQFPAKGKPRVMWVGLKAPPALFTLHQSVMACLTALGLLPPDHPFSPHITLARFKNPPSSETIRPYFAQHSAFKTEAFPVSEFILFSSTLTPHGSVYRHEAIYPLSTPPNV